MAVVRSWVLTCGFLGVVLASAKGYPAVPERQEGQA